jgi:hypothetical protein
MRIAPFVCSAVVLLVVGVATYQLHGYAAAWDAVEKAASRLDSSIQYEPVITMRAKMADLDVALNHYKSLKPPKVVSKLIQHGKTIDQYAAVLSDLARGLDWNTPEFNLYQSQWDAFGVRGFSSEELYPACDKGKLVVFSSSFAQAYKLRGIRDLVTLTGSRTIKSTPFDESGEAARCVAVEQARQHFEEVRAETEKVVAAQRREREQQAEITEAERKQAEEITRKQQRHAASLVECEKFEALIKQGGETEQRSLTPEGDQRILKKCEEVRRGARNDIW